MQFAEVCVCVLFSNWKAKTTLQAGSVITNRVPNARWDLAAAMSPEQFRRRGGGGRWWFPHDPLLSESSLVQMLDGPHRVYQQS
jgi:hypothetical protein